MPHPPRPRRAVRAPELVAGHDRDHRNGWIYWAAYRYAEMIGSAISTNPAAEQRILKAAEANGYTDKRGANAALATMRSGLRTAVAASPSAP